MPVGDVQMTQFRMVGLSRCLCVGRAAMVVALLTVSADRAVAQSDEPLAVYFGFEDQRIIVVDDDAGPVAVADFNGDGLPDLVIVNNRKSRIEIHSLRRAERSASEIERDYRVNDLPPNAWYDRQELSVRHRIGAIAALDVDGDGRMDLVYLGADPQEIVVMLQREPGVFKVAGRRRQRDLHADQDAIAIADVIGDGASELVAIVKGRVGAFALSETGAIGAPVWLGAGDDARGVSIADFDGDGHDDLLVHAPGSATPIRIVRQVLGDGGGQYPREVRLESPPIRAVEVIRVPGQDRALIGVIEAASRRIVTYELREEAFDPALASAGIEEDVQVEVGRLVVGEARGVDTVVIDLDGDGLLDLLATDPARNELVFHRQHAGTGLVKERSFATFKRPVAVVAGQWDGRGPPEVFVLSQEEKAVGVSTYDPRTGALSFPEPIQIATPAAEPTAMAFLWLNGRATIALVVKQRRDLVLELHPAPTPSDPTPDTVLVPLKGVSRAPETILASDADRDGLMDLLLLTPREPMVLVRGEMVGSVQWPTTVVTRDAMKQFGLVSQAGPDNTVLFDVDGDGFEELLIAEENFIRVCAFDADAGWRVVEQTNIEDQNVDLIALAIGHDRGGHRGGSADGEGESVRFIASDKAGSRLLVIERSAAGKWTVQRRLHLLGYEVGPVVLGAFDGMRGETALVLGSSEYAVVPLTGGRAILRERAVYRDDHEGRIEHALASGDINSDGYTDLIVLDAGEQMCSILSIARSGRLVPATEFKVYESRLFLRGDTGEFEPSMALVTDLTGDARDDLLLLVHDRVIVYPQGTKR